MFNNNDYGGGYGDHNRVSDRDRLERDESGKLRGINKREREKGQGREGRGFGGRKSSGGGNNGGKKVLAIIAVITILVIIGIGSTEEGFGGFFRSFNSTPEENLNSFFTSVKKMEADNEREGEPYTVYDRNNMYGDSGIKKQVEKEFCYI